MNDGRATNPSRPPPLTSATSKGLKSPSRTFSSPSSRRSSSPSRRAPSTPTSPPSRPSSRKASRQISAFSRRISSSSSSRTRRTCTERSLLSSNVEIDYGVNGAPDAVRAQTIAKTVQSSGGLSALKSSTNTTATVPAAHRAHVRSPRRGGANASDPRGVAARLDSATITVDGVTATHVTYASDDVEKKDDDTFMFGLTTLVFALICAGVQRSRDPRLLRRGENRRRSSSKVSSAQSQCERARMWRRREHTRTDRHARADGRVFIPGCTYLCTYREH